MATVIADNITSPLGFTSGDNLRAVRAGESGLRHYRGGDLVPFPFTASLFSESQWTNLQRESLTKFESLALHSIEEALSNIPALPSDRTILILSSTKGNVGMLSPRGRRGFDTDLTASAERIAQRLGLIEPPIVVSNACISGVSALILANRLLDMNDADYAIVCGAEEISRFILSGFESLKALSEEECRPFDMERLGLNLGEAAATIVLSSQAPEGAKWQIADGAVRNDAYHLSSPSPQGEGAFLTLRHLMQSASVVRNELAAVNLHGTATMYNDQMESKAISRAGLSDVPANALKGFFGHTMGAAGILETIITMHSLEQGVILPTRNFEEPGVSGKVSLSPEGRSTDRRSFIKMISGFGGGNAAILLRADNGDAPVHPSPGYKVSHRLTLTPDSLTVDGRTIPVDSSGDRLLASLYRERIGGYPKFHKMDSLSKLGFLATELLLQCEGGDLVEGTASRGVYFFNTKGSRAADLAFLDSIGEENFFPSPSLFVYTLPNIVTGEIAIRHGYKGETGFFLLPRKDWSRMESFINSIFCDTEITSAIAGWVEYIDSSHYEADIILANKDTD